MDILYTSDVIPDYVKGGIILFNMKDRVMSRIKSRVWKTLSHVGILYQSMVSGQPTTWITYMDEIYGIISSPLNAFLRNESLPRERGWAIRYIPNFDSTTSRCLNLAISKHSQEDSNLGVDEDNHIMGSFDDELKSILGIPPSNEPKDYNTNIGFVRDILRDFWLELKISESDIPKENTIGFSEDEIVEDDLVKSFYSKSTGSSSEELLKSVNQLLSMVNLSTYTINPPIQPLLTKPLPLFDNKLIVPSEEFYKSKVNGRNSASNIYPRITEERQHVAAVISRMFESGLGTEGVREYFEEELETTTLARRGRNELTEEFTRDFTQAVIDQLKKAKELISKSQSTLGKVERETYNGMLQNLVVAQGSLMTHLNIDGIPIPLESIKL